MPEGMFNVVTCSRDQVAEVGRTLCTSPDVAKISLTGSTTAEKVCVLHMKFAVCKHWYLFVTAKCAIVHEIVCVYVLLYCAFGMLQVQKIAVFTKT